MYLIFLLRLLRTYSFVPVALEFSPRRVLSCFKLSAKSGTKKKKVYDGTIAVNRSARFNYEILDTYDAGISLLGRSNRTLPREKYSL